MIFRPDREERLPGMHNIRHFPNTTGAEEREGKNMGKKEEMINDIYIPELTFIVFYLLPVKYTFS